MPTLHELMSSAARRLKAAGIDSDEAELDAQLFACDLLGWDRARLIAHRREPAPDGFTAAYEALVSRRERREPVSQIRGVREFWGREFEVTRDVLTPRPETEGLVEAAKDYLGECRVIEEIGTGSGCIAVTLALELPSTRLIAVDTSEGALRVARRNAARHGVADRIAFVHGDRSWPASNVDGLVSNPPYVPEGERDALPPEVRDYEPAEALFGGPDGLGVIRHLVALATELRAGGFLLFECGVDQDRPINDMIAREPRLALVEIRPDLAGIPRVVVVRRTDAS